MLVKYLLDRLTEANLATDHSFARLLATNKRVEAFDEPTYRATIRRELEENTDIDWDKAAAFLWLCDSLDPSAVGEGRT